MTVLGASQECNSREGGLRQVNDKGEACRSKPKAGQTPRDQHIRPLDQRARFTLVFHSQAFGEPGSGLEITLPGEREGEICRGELHPPSGPNTNITECGLRRVEKREWRCWGLEIKATRSGQEWHSVHKCEDVSEESFWKDYLEP